VLTTVDQWGHDEHIYQVPARANQWHPQRLERAQILLQERAAEAGVPAAVLVEAAKMVVAHVHYWQSMLQIDQRHFHRIEKASLLRLRKATVT